MILLFLGISLFVNPISVSANNDAKWTYTVQNGIEKSKRSYLLVSDPDSKEEKRFSVISTCEKQLRAEGVYGTCVHQINNETDKVKFTLKTGEEVIMAGIIRDAPLILATVEYGCCAGPDIIRFYTETGKYLGSKTEYLDCNRINKRNVIRSKSDFGFGPFYDGRSYLLVSPDEKSNDLKAIIWESGRLIGSIPVELSFPNKELCPAWTIEQFDGYRDSKYLTLTLRGIECDTDKAIFNCSVSKEKMTCLPKTQAK